MPPPNLGRDFYSPADRANGIRPGDGLASEGRPSERGLSVTTPDACVANAEVQDQIQIPVAVYILDVARVVNLCRFRARPSKPDTQRIDGGGVEIAGGQNRHWNDAIPIPAIDAVGIATWFDVDFDLDHRRSHMDVVIVGV